MYRFNILISMIEKKNVYARTCFVEHRTKSEYRKSKRFYNSIELEMLLMCACAGLFHWFYCPNESSKSLHWHFKTELKTMKNATAQPPPLLTLSLLSSLNFIAVSILLNEWMNFGRDFFLFLHFWFTEIDELFEPVFIARWIEILWWSSTFACACVPFARKCQHCISGRYVC